MKLLKIVTLSCLAFTFSLTACKKEDNESEFTGCRITRAELYDDNEVDFRVNYIYANNSITKIEFPEFGGYCALEYTGDKITKRKFYEEGSNIADSYDQISYNADGTIQKVESFELLTASTYERDGLTTFIYNNGKLSKIQVFGIWDNTSHLYDEYTYTYTGSNITSMTHSDAYGNEKVYSFGYVTEKNFYHTLNTQMFLIDPFLSFDGIIAEYLPLVLSANNLTRVGEDNSTPYSVEYIKDDKGNLTTLLIDGDKYFGYAFDCK